MEPTSPPTKVVAVQRSPNGQAFRAARIPANRPQTDAGREECIRNRRSFSESMSAERREGFTQGTLCVSHPPP